MKAWIIDRSFGIDALTLTERTTPRPGAGQVLVRVRAASLNARDLKVIDGHYNPQQRLPLIPGSDGAGEVAAIGAGVTRVAVGDRVIGTFAQRWISGQPSPEAIGASTLGSPRDGVLAEYVLLEEDGVVRFPDHLSFEEASTLPVAAVTAWHALHGHARLRAGDSVLVQGTGGVAIFALQLARLAGARVIAISSSDDKLARARELGADATINYREIERWDLRARELTDGRGVDNVVDVAGTTLARSVGAVRAGGQVSVIGILAGLSAQLDLIPVLTGRVRIQGIQVGSRDQLDELNRAIGQHRLRPVISRVYPFAAAKEALAALRGGSFVGKLVVSGA
jgi:NADPH:quinone reductase-like Zn-dependent oxidoreductase